MPKSFLTFSVPTEGKSVLGRGIGAQIGVVHRQTNNAIAGPLLVQGQIQMLHFCEPRQRCGAGGGAFTAVYGGAELELVEGVVPVEEDPVILTGCAHLL